MTSTTSTTPILQSATPTVTAGGMSIELVFNTAMAAGSGTITITDGAVQTVIDRATGQPTMRVVGATDTHTISASSVSIAGDQVKLNVTGLLPDHAYSIVMGNGVLVSTANVAFGGVRSTSQVQFKTGPAPDSGAPSLVSHEIDGSLLKADGSLKVTLVFSEPVSGLKADALNAPNAVVSALTPVGDGHSWVATLTPSGAAEQASNVLTIDMSKVHDAAGNAGKGIGNVATYSVDTKGPAATIALDGTALTAGHDIVATLSFSEAVKGLDAAALQAGHASITNISGSADGKTWKVTLHGDGATSAGEVLKLDLGKVADLAGNVGSGTVASSAYAVDTQGPSGVSIALDGGLLKAGGTVGVTFTFSEAIKELPASAITAPHAAIGALASSDGGRTWTGTLTALDPNTSSGNTLSVDMSKLQDLKGNAGSGSFVSSASYAIDTVGPTLSAADIQLNGTTVSTNEGVEVSFKFSEKVSLDAGAILAPNAAVPGLSSSDGGLTWKALLRPGATPVEAGGNHFAIDMGKVRDLAGNAGSGSVSATQAYEVDTKGPSASISLDGTDLRYGKGIEVTIQLSDFITHDDLVNALSAQNATIENLYRTEDGAGLVWKGILQSAGNAVSATNAVAIDLSKLHDAHGNAGAGTASSVNYKVDNAIAAWIDGGIRIQDDGLYNDDYVTSDNQQSIFGTLSAALKPGQHIHLSIDGATKLETDLTPDAKEWDYGSSELYLKDGVYSITAQVVDDAGHASTAVTQQITIDTAGPTMLSSPDGASGSAGEALVFSFDEAVYLLDHEGASIFFKDAAGVQTAAWIWESDFSADRKTVVIPASRHALQTGKEYTIELSTYLTDLAGNSIQNLKPMHFSTVVDTLAPSALSAATSISSGIYGIGKEIDIAVTFSEAVQKAGSGTPALRLTNNGLATWDHTSADGHTVYFKYIVGANGEDDTHGSDSLALVNSEDLVGHVSDLAGNLLDAAHISFSGFDIPWADGYGHHDSGGTIQIDAHASPAPSAPALAAASDTGATGDKLTNLLTPEFTGNGAASYAWVKLFDENGTLLAQTWANGDNTWTISASDWLDGKSLADGTHQLTVKQYDSANNESPASAALTLKVDSAIAAATVTLLGSDVKGSADGDLLTNASKPTFIGTGEIGAHVDVWDGSTIVGQATVGADGTYSVISLYNLAQGQHTLTVEQTDLAGNNSPRSASQWVNFRLDFTGPDAPGKPVLAAASDTGTYNDDGITKETKPLISGVAAEAGGIVNIYDGTTLIGTATVGSDKTWSFTVGSQPDKLAAFADGVHTLTVKQVDAYGNVSAASAALAITVDNVAPTLVATTRDWHDFKNWSALEFNEAINFATNGTIDVLNDSNSARSTHTGNVHLTWTIVPNHLGVADRVLELDIGNSLFGHLHLQIGSGAIVDLAGNVAVITGVPSFDVPS